MGVQQLKHAVSLRIPTPIPPEYEALPYFHICDMVIHTQHEDDLEHR